MDNEPKRRISLLDAFFQINKGELIPFGWQWCVGTVSRPLHRRAAGRWVNLHPSAAGRTAVWRHGGGRPLMKQGNLKARMFLKNSVAWLADSISVCCHYVVLTPDGRLDTFVYFNQQVTHAVPSHPCCVKQCFQVQCVPADSLMFPWDVDLHPSVPHGSGELPMPRVHGQEQPTPPRTHQLSVDIFNDLHKKWINGYFMCYLKLGCGVILGVFPSMTPRSLMVRDPPGSSRALRRSRTEALSTKQMICASWVGFLFRLEIRCSKCYLKHLQDNHF